MDTPSSCSDAAPLQQQQQQQQRQQQQQWQCSLLCLGSQQLTGLAA
jgi:hypothetical protein